MQMEAGLDTGPLLHSERIALDGTETAGTLHDRLAELGARGLLHCLRRLAAGETLPATAQAARGVTYARKLDKTEAELDWTAPAAVLERRVRAFDPWPVAWCRFGDEQVRIWRAACLPQHPECPPGTVVTAGRAGIDVATARGTLRLLELQPAGKRRMSAADFLNGRTLPGRLAGAA
jgi:methionyl-tRNA formyltransferase